jgi:hypothetical protein
MPRITTSYDYQPRRRRRYWKAYLAFVLYGLFVLSLFCGAIFVLAHFIVKYW